MFLLKLYIKYNLLLKRYLKNFIFNIFFIFFLNNFRFRFFFY